ncbi:hypothetical protein SAMN04487944_1296 [Gracilibacillus ureilyticus]|uniref:Uncharacterized protein n=1 Tax=Gracilibacillus ureilyticus TaxID=531814 RepID=A0A1H9VWP5_9BACI|nr:hypothetical protein [Gracilibacillus ureilyticus]SES26085.1 hypothetical protein SAMN04487944_1296 [Gracilibacillus ureilyticus]
MGYIIPIENYSYQQYQSRITKEERDPFPIEELYPVQFNMHYENEKLKEKPKDSMNFKQTAGTHVYGQAVPGSIRNEKVYAEVTGKGRQFVAEA